MVATEIPLGSYQKGLSLEEIQRDRILRVGYVTRMPGMTRFLSNGL